MLRLELLCRCHGEAADAIEHGPGNVSARGSICSAAAREVGE
jgi:hypothetical protein